MNILKKIISHLGNPYLQSKIALYDHNNHISDISSKIMKIAEISRFSLKFTQMLHFY